MAVTPGLQLPCTLMANVRGLPLQQALRGEHVADLGGADAEGQRAEGAVGAGVAVAADDGLAGLGEPSSGPMMCTMPRCALLQAEQLDAELGAVPLQLRTWRAAESIAIGAPPNTCSVRVGVE